MPAAHAACLHNVLQQLGVRHEKAILMMVESVFGVCRAWCGWPGCRRSRHGRRSRSFIMTIIVMVTAAAVAGCRRRRRRRMKGSTERRGRRDCGGSGGRRVALIVNDAEDTSKSIFPAMVSRRVPAPHLGCCIPRFVERVMPRW